MISVKAYAKINLSLNVLNKREDGYHDIDTIMLPLELHDRIDFDFLPQDVGTLITSSDLNLPNDESNLAIKAYRLIKEKFNIKKKFRIHIHKKIPLSAGLGGGSSDAALVIRTILQMMKIHISNEELIELAKLVGADVPFALFSKPARCKGIGGDLEFFQLKDKYHCLIIKPEHGVETKKAYATFDEIGDKKLTDIDSLKEGLILGNEGIIINNLFNGLEEPAIKLVPEIGVIKQKIIEDGFPLTLMTGSGSSIFVLSKDYKALLKESYKFDSEKYYIQLTSIL